VIRVVAVLALGLMIGVLASCLPSRAENTPVGDAAMAAARHILGEAVVEKERSCTNPSDVLVRVLCDNRLRVGVRTYYPGFAVRDVNGTFSGFEIDLARRIARFLGVNMLSVPVDPKNRIPMVAANDIDVVIATMGHSLLRDSQVRYIRPHYYQSRTVVVGAKDQNVTDWDDLGGKTVCLPVGSSSNIVVMRHHVRILTFDRPEQLIDALNFNQCAFVMHDDTFFAAMLADPDWSSRFGVKFGFAPLPWGMAVARSGAAQLADLLTDLSIAYHANGVFLTIAKDNGLDTAYLTEEQKRWSTPGCVAADGSPVASCLIPPADDTDALDIARIAPEAKWLEAFSAQWFGTRLDLSLLEHESTLELLLEGVGFSLALVLGTMLSTLGFAVLFARLMGWGPIRLRRIVDAVVSIAQTSPLPLLMFVGYVVAGGLTQYTAVIALVTAVLVVGIYNGANAARAINDAYQANMAPRGAQHRSFMEAVSVAGIQLVAFLINAAKSSPAAGMIGVPEFLNVMTDLTAYSRDRVEVYLVLLVFYTGLVLIVIAGLTRLELRLEAAMQRRR
jgi:ABC-type amino acid transport substrate-binding protein/ABC-type amino acid transport system permease subunit